jgi:uncharacterized protein YjbI with pentapeptide repeats
MTGLTREQPQRPTSDDPDVWRVYWVAMKLPWRFRPEINELRQQELRERQRSIIPDIIQGVYPFKGLDLGLDDIEWLLTTHENDGWQGPVDWSDEQQRRRVGLDLRGANLRELDLRYLPLARIQLGLSLDDWEVATAEQRELAAAHLEVADLREAHLEGAWLSSAHLEGADLFRVHLEQAYLVGVHLEGANLSQAKMTDVQASLTLESREEATSEQKEMAAAHLEGANLHEAHMEEALFNDAHLEGVDLGLARLDGIELCGAHLEEAFLISARLERSNLRGAHLEGAILSQAHLEGADVQFAHLESTAVPSDDLARIRRWKDTFPAYLPPTELRAVAFDVTTVLHGITFGGREHDYAPLRDISWGGVNLSLIDWMEGGYLGDERLARQRRTRNGKRKDRATRLGEFEDAVRANRQVAAVLRGQGLNEYADRFAYRAQLLQRIVLRRQRRFLRYLASGFIDFISGYGYRPIRSFIAYVVVILGFATAYFALGDASGQPLPWNEALVVSMTAFHGRGFFAAVFKPGDLQAAVAAIEAFVGLLIEIVLIATFTQRIFGR